METFTHWNHILIFQDPWAYGDISLVGWRWRVKWSVSFIPWTYLANQRNFCTLKASTARFSRTNCTLSFSSTDKTHVKRKMGIYIVAPIQNYEIIRKKVKYSNAQENGGTSKFFPGSTVKIHGKHGCRGSCLVPHFGAPYPPYPWLCRWAGKSTGGPLGGELHQKWRFHQRKPQGFHTWFRLQKKELSIQSWSSTKCKGMCCTGIFLQFGG